MADFVTHDVGPETQLRAPSCTCGGRGVCTVCVLNRFEGERAALRPCPSTTSAISGAGRVWCDGLGPAHPGPHYNVMTGQSWSA